MSLTVAFGDVAVWLAISFIFLFACDLFDFSNILFLFHVCFRSLDAWFLMLAFLRSCRFAWYQISLYCFFLLLFISVFILLFCYHFYSVSLEYCVFMYASAWWSPFEIVFICYFMKMLVFISSSFCLSLSWIRSVCVFFSLSILCLSFQWIISVLLVLYFIPNSVLIIKILLREHRHWIGFYSFCLLRMHAASIV